jgi:predicted XRE-type DNA-binding protein
VEDSSGNFFANLRFPNADREHQNAKLMLEIYRAVKDRNLTQVEAGDILGIQQPHVSTLMNGRSGNYSLGRLFDLLECVRTRGRDRRAPSHAVKSRPHERCGAAVAAGSQIPERHRQRDGSSAVYMAPEPCS